MHVKAPRLLLDRLVEYAREQAAVGKEDEVRQRLSAWSEAYGFETWTRQGRVKVQLRQLQPM